MPEIRIGDTVNGWRVVDNGGLQSGAFYRVQCLECRGLMILYYDEVLRYKCDCEPMPENLKESIVTGDVAEELTRAAKVAEAIRVLQQFAPELLR